MKFRATVAAVSGETAAARRVPESSTPTRRLKVSGSGTGKVYYKGQPSKVTVRKLGTIKAIPME